MSYVIDTKMKETIVGLAKQFPNDQDLGKLFRSTNVFHGISLEFPNDQELGRELRRLVKIKSK